MSIIITPNEPEYPQYVNDIYNQLTNDEISVIVKTTIYQSVNKCDKWKIREDIAGFVNRVSETDKIGDVIEVVVMANALYPSVVFQCGESHEHTCPLCSHKFYDCDKDPRCPLCGKFSFEKEKE